MRMTLAGLPILDLVTEARNLAVQGVPIPAEFGRANTLLNPLGDAPARGWFLMLRRDVEALNKGALHQLVLDDGGSSATLHGLVFVAARKVTHGKALDDHSAYLVEVTDGRGRCANRFFTHAVHKQYNVRAPGWSSLTTSTTSTTAAPTTTTAGPTTTPVPRCTPTTSTTSTTAAPTTTSPPGVTPTPGGSYYADSLDAGQPWTWERMAADLWGLLASQIGPWPGLPFTPDGIPEGWRFVGTSAWAALCGVLGRLGCAVRWDPTKPLQAYTIVRVGIPDKTFAETETKAAKTGRLLADEEWIEGTRGRQPGGVRVYFHRLQMAGTEEATDRAIGRQWSMAPLYSVDVSSTAAGGDAGTDVGVFHPLWDDAPALFSPDGSLLNATSLQSRATERATDFYRTLKGEGGGRVSKTYSGIWPLVPGSTCKGVAWRQAPQRPGPAGLVTEIVRHPWRLLEASDVGAWAERLEDSTSLFPPDFRPGLPVYPGLVQVLRLTDSTPVFHGNRRLFPAVVERSNGDGTFTQGETVWASDVADHAAIAAGSRYQDARLSGFLRDRPLYLIRHAPLDQQSAAGTTTPRPGTTTATCGSLSRFRWSSTACRWSLLCTDCTYPCVPQQPVYCGSVDGEETSTFCGLGPGVPTCCQCAGSTSTTAGPTTTTGATTTQIPACLDPCKFRWYDSLHLWVKYGSDGCDTPPYCCGCTPPSTPGISNCQIVFVSCSPCQATTTPPPPVCGGLCGPFHWNVDERFWFTNGVWRNCSATPGCDCDYPSFQPEEGACVGPVFTPCRFPAHQTTVRPGDSTTTLRPLPCRPSTTCSPNSCCGNCYWEGDGASGWDFVRSDCPSYCSCYGPPAYPSSSSNETAVTPCVRRPTTTTPAPTTTTTASATCTTTTTTPAPQYNCYACYFLFSGETQWRGPASVCSLIDVEGVRDDRDVRISCTKTAGPFGSDSTCGGGCPDPGTTTTSTTPPPSYRCFVCYYTNLFGAPDGPYVFCSSDDLTVPLVVGDLTRTCTVSAGPFVNDPTCDGGCPAPPSTSTTTTPPPAYKCYACYVTYEFSPPSEMFSLCADQDPDGQPYAPGGTYVCSLMTGGPYGADSTCGGGCAAPPTTTRAPLGPCQWTCEIGGDLGSYFWYVSSAVPGCNYCVEPPYPCTFDREGEVYDSFCY